MKRFLAPWWAWWTLLCNMFVYFVFLDIKKHDWLGTLIDGVMVTICFLYAHQAWEEKIK